MIFVQTSLHLSRISLSNFLGIIIVYAETWEKVSALYLEKLHVLGFQTSASVATSMKVEECELTKVAQRTVQTQKRVKSNGVPYTDRLQLLPWKPFSNLLLKLIPRMTVEQRLE